MTWDRQHTEKHQDKGPQINQTENPPSREFPLVHPIVMIHRFYMPLLIFSTKEVYAGKISKNS